MHLPSAFIVGVVIVTAGTALTLIRGYRRDRDAITYDTHIHTGHLVRDEMLAFDRDGWVITRVFHNDGMQPRYVFRRPCNGTPPVVKTTTTAVVREPETN